MICCVFISKAQMPQFESNTTDQEKLDSFIYQNIRGLYNQGLAYTQSGYWNSNTKSYTLLLFKNGVWYKGYLYSKRINNNVWSKPRLKLKKAKTNKVIEIFNGLNSAGLWTMSKDSLNIHERRNREGGVTKLSLYDGYNYHFEIFNGENLAIIESYAPEYSLEELPENKILERFIKARDWFVINYKVL